MFESGAPTAKTEEQPKKPSLRERFGKSELPKSTEQFKRAEELGGEMPESIQTLRTFAPQLEASYKQAQTEFRNLVMKSDRKDKARLLLEGTKLFKSEYENELGAFTGKEKMKLESDLVGMEQKVSSFHQKREELTQPWQTALEAKLAEVRARGIDVEASIDDLREKAKSEHEMMREYTSAETKRQQLSQELMRLAPAEGQRLTSVHAMAEFLKTRPDLLSHLTNQGMVDEALSAEKHYAKIWAVQEARRALVAEGKMPSPQDFRIVDSLDQGIMETQSKIKGMVNPLRIKTKSYFPGLMQHLMDEHQLYPKEEVLPPHLQHPSA